VAQSAGIKLVTNGAVIYTNVGRRRLPMLTGVKRMMNKKRVKLQEEIEKDDKGKFFIIFWGK